MSTDRHYIVTIVVCPVCGEIMKLTHIISYTNDNIIIYLCKCGYRLNPYSTQYKDIKK